MVADLRDGGHLDQSSYDRLLDRLYARKLLDQLEYSRRGGRNAPTAEDEPLPQVAEREEAYDTTHTPKDGQKTVRIDSRSTSSGKGSLWRRIASSTAPSCRARPGSGRAHEH